MIKHYLVNKRDRYTIDLRPQSDGTIKLFALDHPADPYGNSVGTHHLYSSGEICVSGGRKPRSFDKAAAIAMVWCEGWSTYIRVEAERQCQHRTEQPGDHVIIPTLDRGFRDTEDLLNTVNSLWLPKRVAVHFLDINLDLSTPIGQLVMTIVGAVSRWEAAITSERNKAAAARLRAQNRPTNGTKRTGFKLATIGGVKQWVPDKRERRLLQEIVRFHDDEHKTFEEIARLIEPAVCKYEGRPYKDSAFHAWSWSPSKCRHAYRRHKEILEKEVR